MFNVGGGELLVILLVAMIVLGPTKLPEAARQVGGFLNHIRRVSNDFKRELQDAVPEELTELTRDLDETRRTLRSSLTDDAIERKARAKGRALMADKSTGVGADTSEGSNPSAAKADAASSAAVAGMYPDGSDEAKAVAVEREGTTDVATSTEAAEADPSDDMGDNVHHE